MLRANTLVFEEIKIINKGLRFYYSIDGISYSFYSSTGRHEPVTLSIKNKYLIAIHIGLAYLIDLAVICCPKKIIIKTVKLSREQLSFWQFVYNNAANERAYLENENLHYLDTKWESIGETLKKIDQKIPLRNDTQLISFSGGKESISIIKIFENMNSKFSIFTLDYNDKASYHMRKSYELLSQEISLIKINTNISHVQSLLNKYQCKDYSLFVIGQIIFNALLFNDKFKFVIIGNEYSSNFPNATYKGQIINHQYDKTIDFFKKINEYVKDNIDPDFYYYSPFFGLYEYKITSIFFQNKKYLNIWTSCNSSSKKYNFCCKCPKCAFIYIISLPWVDTVTLNEFFWSSPLENLNICRPLIDLDSAKPIDCVGEKKECWLALSKQVTNKKLKSSPVMQFFINNILPVVEQDLHEIELELHAEHTNFEYIPKPFVKMLESELK